MKQSAILLLLASAVWATPLAIRDEVATTKPSYVTKCEGAINCELYKDAKGKLKPRFKQGMEPGTAVYDEHQKAAKSKRDGGSSTEITVSDSMIYWGCDVDPVATLNNVSSVCQTSGNCLSDSPFTLPVEYIEPNSNVPAPSGETMSIKASGSYPAWLRNGMITALQTVMSGKGMITTSTAKWGAGPVVNGRGGGLTAGSCQVSQAPSEIVLSYYSAPNTMEGSVDVTVSLKADESGFCGGPLGDATTLIGSISGAFGAYGAGVAAIFGTISASCTIANGS